MGNKKKPDFDQAAAIPFRRRDGEVEFCLITAAVSGRWTIPKGIIDPGHTAAEAAVNETLEEAGLHGEIVGEPLGDYRYRKWGASLKVQVFLLEVTQVDKVWDEMAFRDRRWVAPGKARELLERHPARRLLIKATERLGDVKA